MLPPIIVMNARRSITRCSLDDLVGTQQQRLRDREAECLGRLEIDDQLELRGLLDWKICGLGAFEDLVDVDGDLTEQRRDAAAIEHEPSLEHELPRRIHGGQALLSREVEEACTVRD